MCGGTPGQGRRPRAGCGLSPRVRGNPGAFTPHMASSGSIPACAGEPDGHRLPVHRLEVYPRVCGGTALAIFTFPLVIGLSPRVRGNQPLIVHCLNANRSIPACAGEPRHYRSLRSRCRVYPRVCGGTTGPLYRSSRRRGLSPRVRGNQLFRATRRQTGGSIPACAGEP